MTVTVDTAPFDLGDGHHGIVARTADTVEEFIDHGTDPLPPRWVLDALEPCDCACHRLKSKYPGIRHDVLGDCRSDGSCHDGKPVVELQVVPPLRGFQDALPWPGLVSAGRWTVTEALPIYHSDGLPDDESVPCVEVNPYGEVWFHPDGYGFERLLERKGITVPGDPADLIGNYLVIVEPVT